VRPPVASAVLALTIAGCGSARSQVYDIASLRDCIAGTDAVLVERFAPNARTGVLDVTVETHTFDGGFFAAFAVGNTADDAATRLSKDPVVRTLRARLDWHAKRGNLAYAGGLLVKRGMQAPGGIALEKRSEQRFSRCIDDAAR
jgi:hypothetical protein